MANLRTEMPTCAQFIDDLRTAFGDQAVNGWIRAGMADGSFHASENGHTIGGALVEPANAVSGTHLVLQAPEPEQAPERQRSAFSGSRSRSRR